MKSVLNNFNNNETDDRSFLLSKILLYKNI